LLIHNDAVIFSGALISVNALKKAEIKIDEKLFLDHADTDYFNRLRKKGCLTAICTQPLLIHRLGKPINPPIKLFKKIEIKSTTTPIRFYYIMRNATYLLIRKRITIVQWILSTTRFALPLIFQDRRGLVKASILGIAHAITGRLGYLPPTTIK
jgi:GT2 family glycosyltransferase